MRLGAHIALLSATGLMAGVLASVPVVSAQSTSQIMRDSHEKMEAQLETMDIRDFQPAEDKDMQAIAESIFEQSKKIATLEAEQQLKMDMPEQPSNKAIYFVSFSMSDAELRSVIIDAAETEGAVLVFRGLKDDANMGHHGRALGKVIKGMDKDDLPAITINPPLFDQYQVQVVPELIIVDKEENIARARGGISAKTLMGYAQEEPNKADFGVFGKTYEIAETHMIDLMKARMAKIDFSKQKEGAHKKYWDKKDLFTEVPKAQKSARRVVPTLVEITNDVQTRAGTVLASKGERFDAAKRMPLSRWYIVFDATDPKHRKFARQASERAEHAGKAPSLLITHFDKSTGWDGFTQLQQEMGQRVKLANQAFVARFDVQAIPAIVRQDGEQIVVEEYKLEGAL
jgi:type-F conjugative transfer system pilin assembly protein TrbC